MPSYEYKCNKCNKTQTVVKPMSKCSEPEYCLECGEKMQRIYTPVGNKWNCPGAYDGRLK